MVDNDFFHSAEGVDPDWNPGMKEPVLMLTSRERWLLVAAFALCHLYGLWPAHRYQKEIDALRRKLLGRP